MSELPMGTLPASSVFFFEESIKREEVRSCPDSRQEMEESDGFSGLVFLLIVNQERRG